jgi:pilus assembly protein FimV
MGSRGLARFHAVAAAAVLSTVLMQPGDAQALALGRIVVQSALGEPLRAEIDVPDINADEAASLRVGLASGEAFRAAGMDFNPALSNLQISLQRRADGRAYLRLTSTRAVTEPFVDLIVEANWSSGRIVRDYTLLFDPPNLRAGAPSTPLPPVVAPTAPAQVSPPVARPAPPIQPAPGAVAAPAPAAPPVSNRPAAPSRDTGGNGQVRVRPGDTAGRIAEANRTANVSLDQMLVAMLRGNPGAFIGGNVNRIRAGSVLDLPSEAEAVAVNPGEARQMIAAQSRDFNEFRRRLAGSVPAAAIGAADRQATGRVQAEVEDRRPAAPSQDKLTLSKGATPAASATEEKIAQERQAQEASTRVAELSRNIEELARLGAAPANPGTSPAGIPPGTNAPVPGMTAPPLPTMTTTTAPEPAVEPLASGAVTPTATAAVAPSPTAEQTPAAAPAPAPQKPVPVEEASLIDDLRDNPFVLPGAAALLALLGGLGIYRLRQRKKVTGVDSSFLESRLQPDSFFGSSGGQRIDTAEASASGSSMVYSPSQLDAAGDVDPVAEADVYLAYGRDLQAEEILKEAMRSTPTRVAIHSKLLEIYAKRRDAKAFEVVATEAYRLTEGQGPEWEHACDLGRELDPDNPLYQPGGAPPVKAGGPVAGIGGAVNTQPFGNSALDQPGSDPLPHGLDLDLDFSFDEPSAPAPLQDETVVRMLPDKEISALDDLEGTDALTRDPGSSGSPTSMPMDFDLDFPSDSAALLPNPATPSASGNGAGDLSLDFDELPPPDFELSDLDADAPFADDKTPLPMAHPQEHPEPELMSFDLNDINLDLGTDLPPTDDVDDPFGGENPLETKLSLAEEFRAIGDLEGARSLAEEVLAEATGTLKTKASTFLADLS